MPATFRAFIVNKTEDGFSAEPGRLSAADLPAGEVLIRVACSGVNYKDGLASIPDGKVVRTYPFVPGIDLAGVVEESSDARFKAGDEVIVTSYELGVSHYGGFSEYARVKADWVVPKPAGLTLTEAMALGTAGFTAALAVHQLEKNGLKPEKGPVLVTGATGGAGSVAVSILHKLGYQVTASTGKKSEHSYLRELGANEILDRSVTSAESTRPLEKELWAGCVDAVGGSTLAYLLRTTKYGGSVAAFGNTGGFNFSTTVFPFILRGVNLLGIDSVLCPMDLRRELWQRLASTYKPEKLLSAIGHEVGFEELPAALTRVLKGEARGHTIIRIS
ncbi:MAG TPA: acryloyl-CoA reductase [Ktedonobacteraceae bacterium]|nr:acryloyl-CoA reductase [Ktedonobacteraceae bacterium]